MPKNKNLAKALPLYKKKVNAENTVDYGSLGYNCALSKYILIIKENH